MDCVPESLCSWNYTIDSLPSGTGYAEFDFFTQTGSVRLHHQTYTVQKQGLLLNDWLLIETSTGATLGRAIKPNLLFRHYELEVEQVRFVVRAESVLLWDFGIYQEESLYGSIRPVHPFTRRADFYCDPQIPELGQLFAFWLVILAWRNQARSN